MRDSLQPAAKLGVDQQRSRHNVQDALRSAGRQRRSRLQRSEHDRLQLDVPFGAIRFARRRRHCRSPARCHRLCQLHGPLLRLVEHGDQPGGVNAAGVPAGGGDHIGSFTTVTPHLSYSPGAFLKGTQVFLDVTNLSDRNPPFVNRNSSTKGMGMTHFSPARSAECSRSAYEASSDA